MHACKRQPGAGACHPECGNARLVKRRFLKFAVLVEGSAPPTEFRIFRAGVNESTKGPATFDAEAAKAVMAAWQDYGNDLPVDYCHAMIRPAIDPAEAGKAAGWFDLEVRDGELWAVNVRWTEAAAQALMAKEYRYVSPAFYTDEEGRVVEIVNVALTNIPATKDQDALMAASREARDCRTRSTGLSFLEISEAINGALRAKHPDDEYVWVCDVFNSSVVYEVAGRLFECTYSLNDRVVELGAAVQVRRAYVAFSRSEPNMKKKLFAKALAATKAGDKAQALVVLEQCKAFKYFAMDPARLKEAVEAIKAGDGDAALSILEAMIVGEASGGAEEEGATDEGADDPGTALESTEDETAVAAAATRLTRITAKSTMSEAVDEVELWRRSHLELEAEKKKIATERAQLEAAERRKLYGELVTRGGAKPATVWADDKATKAKPYLERMTITELRQHVADAVGSTPTRGSGPLPPTGSEDAAPGGEFVTPHGPITLSARELANCKAAGADPATYAANKAIQMKARQAPVES